MKRSVCLFIATTAITTMLLLGFARLPGGERLAGMLNHQARVWFSAPFEQTLADELASVRDPQLRPMLMQLIMLHIAKDARLARQQVVGFNPLNNRQDLLPGYALQASQTVNAIRAGDIVSIGPGGSSIAPVSSVLNGWAALGFFLMAVLWVTMRRG